MESPVFTHLGCHIQRCLNCGGKIYPRCWRELSHALRLSEKKRKKEKARKLWPFLFLCSLVDNVNEPNTSAISLMILWTAFLRAFWQKNILLSLSFILLGIYLSHAAMRSISNITTMWNVNNRNFCISVTVLFLISYMLLKNCFIHSRLIFPCIKKKYLGILSD